MAARCGRRLDSFRCRLALHAQVSWLRNSLMAGSFTMRSGLCILWHPAGRRFQALRRRRWVAQSADSGGRTLGRSPRPWNGLGALSSEYQRPQRAERIDSASEGFHAHRGFAGWHHQRGLDLSVGRARPARRQSKSGRAARFKPRIDRDKFANDRLLFSGSMIAHASHRGASTKLVYLS